MYEESGQEREGLGKINWKIVIIKIQNTSLNYSFISTKLHCSDITVSKSVLEVV